MTKAAHKTLKTRPKENRQTKIKLMESRLAEAEETLRAIRSGEVDAFAIETASGPQIFTLKGSEQPYRVMVDTMNEGAVTLTSEGMIIYCNKRFADMVNTAMKNVIGTSIYRFIKQEEKPLFDKLSRKVSKRKRERIEIFLEVAGGTSMPVLISMSGLNDAVPGSMCILFTDVAELRKAQQEMQESHDRLELRVAQRTHELQVYQIELEMQNNELRRIQEELEASRARYFDLYDLAPVGYFMLNDRGMILKANLTAAKLLGMVKGIILSQPLARFIFRDDRDIFSRHLKLLSETGIQQVCEFRMMRKDAAPFWVRMEAHRRLENGNAETIYRAIIIDITESKKIEETQLFLLQSGYSGEDFFLSLAKHLALSLSMDCVGIDRLLTDNLTAQTMAVYSDGKFEDNVEHNLKDTPCGDAVGKSICCFSRDVRHLYPKDVMLQKMSAEGYVGCTIWSARGQPIGLISILSRKKLAHPRLAELILKLVAIRAAAEIERREAEAKLKAHQIQLEAANKELESFSYSISHDLRAPLRAIDGFSRIILRQEGNKFDDKTNHQFNHIRKNVKLMGVLIEDLLSFSRVQKTGLNISVIDMDKLTRDLCDEIREINKEQNIEFKIKKVQPGYGDSTLIRQVVINLLSNAAKFTKNKEQGLIEISSYTDDGKAVYCIKDNGAGFDMAHYDKLFGVFQRLHSSEEYEGTGIGLAIVQRIVERHKGRVWAESEVGKGATFYFSLTPAPA